MIKWVKRHFIPHEGNDHRPHFLHRRNVKQLIGVVLLLELALFVLPGLNFVKYFENLNLGAVLPGVLSSLTNAERLENNLPELRESEVLNRAAQLKAEDMARKGYFAHTSPEGITPWYWLNVVGYSYSYAGENLAVHFIDSQDVTEAWMNSPTHRANIVHGAYTEVGTGVAVGMYEGYETVFVAQVYGRPQAVVASASQTNSRGLTRQNPTGSDTDRNLQTSPTPQLAEAVLGESQPAPVVQQKTTGLKQVAENFVEEAAASPRHTTDAMLYSVMGIVTLALIFNIFIKMKHQHPDLIFNGAVAMVVILGLHIGNTYISKEQYLRTTFIAYDSQTQVLNQ